MEKVVKLGIVREKNWLYFLRGSDVWRTPFKGMRPCGESELVARTGLVRKRNHLYFLDSSGDICSHKRKPDLRPKRRRQPARPISNIND